MLKRISAKNIQLFTQQLSTLLLAKLPLIKSLTILAEEQENKSFKQLIKKIIKSLEDGQSFSKTLSKFPNYFSSFYSNMLLIGEQSGTIDQMLDRINHYLLEKESLKQKVWQALTYPIIIISITVLAFVFLMIFVVPEFQTMFKDYKTELPQLTKLVLGSSEFFTRYIVYILGTFLLFVLLFLNAYKSKKFKRQFSSFLIQLPILGQFMKNVFIARICMILSVLLEARVNLLEALEITRSSMQNPIVEKELKKMMRFIKRGDKLTQSLNRSKIFPAMVVQMISVGEESASIHQMLKSISDVYSKELDRSILRITTLLEPLIIVTLGIMIGFIVVAIYLPMFELSNMMY